MCRICRQNCRGIRFDFQCKKFYRDYCKSSAFVKPDAIFFFNAALHRPGFRGFETWPKTIQSAIDTSVPVFVTSCKHHESTLDFRRVREIVPNDILVLQTPTLNPYASTQPERYFSADDAEPITFKNQFYFIVRKVQDLIEL